jgi:serine-type D-Ala-D-Ala carboxypeptidase/endopeptidase (penicillin-binding protein 4)
VFRALWEGAGGTWTGKVRDAPVPAEARRIALHESEPLASVVRDINKFSNNVMARQLYLTMGAEAARQPAGTEAAERAVRGWLASRGLEMPELVLENGAGLSRIERIAPASLARLLLHAFASPLMPEFMSSLPLVGVDGTMKKRNGAAGNAHIKTGLLADVRAIAGYVHAASGRRYVVVAIINHPNARDGQPAHDALLEWVYRNG